MVSLFSPSPSARGTHASSCYAHAPPPPPNRAQRRREAGVQQAGTPAQAPPNRSGARGGSSGSSSGSGSSSSSSSKASGRTRAPAPPTAGAAAKAVALGAPEGSATAARLAALIAEQEEEEIDSEGEGEGEWVVNEKEVERLVFGKTDFSSSGGGASKQDGAAQLAACRSALGLPPLGEEAAQGQGGQGGQQGQQGQGQVVPAEVAELAFAAAAAGLVAAEPQSLAVRTARVVEAVGGQGGGGVLAAVARLAGAAAGLQGGGVTAEVFTVEAMAAALLVPRVVCLAPDELRARLAALQTPAFLGKSVSAGSLAPLVLAHPELLVAALPQLESKLTTLRNTTGLTGEGAVEMLNPWLFGL